MTGYSLFLERHQYSMSLSLTAINATHAQAQAEDISRALNAETFAIVYKRRKESRLAKLFRRLSTNDFRYNECDQWDGSYLNEVPVAYALGQRLYVRPMILDYLEINKDGVVKPSCNNKKCINPYHNSYKKMKASKLGDADINLALAFASQGVPVTEIAKALKVNRSTIYRVLKSERFHFGSSSDRPCHHRRKQSDPCTSEVTSLKREKDSNQGAALLQER